MEKDRERQILEHVQRTRGASDAEIARINTLSKTSTEGMNSTDKHKSSTGTSTGCLRRAVGRGAAGTDPVPRCGALVGRSASIDALYSVDLVRERRPARGRAKSSCCAPGG